MCAQKAAEGRDALAMQFYHAIFCQIAQRANQSIGFRDRATFCGVLDIFGFEFFEVNSFEQLCINYTNELPSNDDVQCGRPAKFRTSSLPASS